MNGSGGAETRFDQLIQETGAPNSIQLSKQYVSYGTGRPPPGELRRLPVISDPNDPGLLLFLDSITLDAAGLWASGMDFSRPEGARPLNGAKRLQDI